VAFASPANDLAPGDLNLAPDIFVADSATGRIRLISQRDPLLPAATGAPGLQDARTFRSASVSADGQVVAYGNVDPISSVSAAKAWQDLFVTDRRRGTTQPVSNPLIGPRALPNYAAAPMLSADGRFMAYLAPPATPSDAQATELVWLDLSNGGRKTFPSSTLVPEVFGGTALRAVLSSDGRFVAERWSNPTNLAGLDLWDMFAAVPAPEPIPLDGPQGGNATDPAHRRSVRMGNGCSISTPQPGSTRETCPGERRTGSVTVRGLSALAPSL
jgi:hypothetical protein